MRDGCCRPCWPRAAVWPLIDGYKRRPAVVRCMACMGRHGHPSLSYWPASRAGRGCCVGSLGAGRARREVMDSPLPAAFGLARKLPVYKLGRAAAAVNIVAQSEPSWPPGPSVTAITDATLQNLTIRIKGWTLQTAEVSVITVKMFPCIPRSFLDRIC